MILPVHHLRNSLLIALGFLITLLTIYGLSIYDRQLNLTLRGSHITFSQLIKNDLNEKVSQIQILIKDLPSLIDDSKKADTDIHYGTLNTVSQALELYNINNNSYPETIEELVDEYLAKLPDQNKIPLNYTRTVNGYYLSTKLPNGQIISHTP